VNTPQHFWTQRAGAPGPGRSRGALQIASGTVWLLFIAFPLTGNLTAHLPSWRHVLAVIGAALFIATYLGIVACGPASFWARHEWMRWVLYSVLLAVSIALTLGDPYGWGCLFIYCAA
jgi:hypothetical protein